MRRSRPVRRSPPCPWTPARVRPSPRRREPLRSDLLQPLRRRERRRAFAGQHHVRRRLHHRPRGADRRGEALQRRHRAGAAGWSVHQAGVEFELAGAIGRGAAAGDVEAGRLQRRDRLHHHVQRRRRRPAAGRGRLRSARACERARACSRGRSWRRRRRAEQQAQTFVRHGGSSAFRAPTAFR